MDTISNTADEAPYPVIQTADSSPYPPLCVCEPNIMYAGLLQQDAFSQERELTSVSSYLFQGWVLPPELAEIAETFHSIAKVEMHHLNTLGSLITALGGVPTFSSRAGKHNPVWDGNMVFYSTCLKTMLKENIQQESSAINSYHYHAAVIKDSNVSAVLNRIILDEQIHLSIFQDFFLKL